MTRERSQAASQTPNPRLIRQSRTGQQEHLELEFLRESEPEVRDWGVLRSVMYRGVNVR
jgi:hypothetical protein